ncbi:MAG: hypothetical protein U5L72_12935 [Bacteroidales bacterium]|nr:hypothetical protein [Bacteroidales bacterium]
MTRVTGEYIYDLGNLAGLPTRPAGASPGRHVVAETLWNDDLFTRNVLSARTYVDLMFLKDFKFTLNVASDVSAYNAAGFENKVVGDGAPAGRGKRVNSLTTEFYRLMSCSTTGRPLMFVQWRYLLGHENYDYTYNYLRGFRQGQIVDGNTELVNFKPPMLLHPTLTSTGLKVISPVWTTRLSMRSNYFQVLTVVMPPQSLMQDNR